MTAVTTSGEKKTRNRQRPAERVAGIVRSAANDLRSVDAIEVAQRLEGLAIVIEMWPDLPEAVKAGIVAMVEATNGKRC